MRGMPMLWPGLSQPASGPFSDYEKVTCYPTWRKRSLCSRDRNNEFVQKAV
jgi:hypothetical protein